jgi:hypothetical protein
MAAAVQTDMACRNTDRCVYTTPFDRPVVPDV